MKERSDNMGNSNSIGANLSVQLNQGQVICGGSKLRGTIYLSVEKDSVSADSLNVKFYGLESTQVYVSGGESSTRYNEQHQIIGVEYVLSRFGGQVNRGRYEYPFEITLPIGLPGKQGNIYNGTVKNTYHHWFVVEYFLEARLHRHGMMKWDVKNSQEIFMSDPPYYSTKIPSFMEPITQRVLFCGCHKTGTMTLQANVDSTNVFINDKFQIEFAVRNDSTSKVVAIEISVIETAHFSARRYHHNYSSIIHSQRITNCSEYNNIPKSDSSIDSLRKAVKVIEVNIPYLRSRLPSRHDYYGITPEVRPSYNGRLGIDNPEVLSYNLQTAHFFHLMHRFSIRIYTYGI